MKKAVDQPSPWVPLFLTRYNPVAFATGLTLLLLPCYSSHCSHPYKGDYLVENCSSFISPVNNSLLSSCSYHVGLFPFSFVFNLQIPLKLENQKVPLLCPYLQGERREKLSSAFGKISHVGVFLFRKFSNAIYQLITGLHLCPLIPPAVFQFWKGL